MAEIVTRKRNINKYDKKIIQSYWTMTSKKSMQMYRFVKKLFMLTFLTASVISCENNCPSSSNNNASIRDHVWVGIVKNQETTDEKDIKIAFMSGDISDLNRSVFSPNRSSNTKQKQAEVERGIVFLTYPTGYSANLKGIYMLENNVLFITTYLDDSSKEYGVRKISEFVFSVQSLTKNKLHLINIDKDCEELKEIILKPF